MDEYLVYCPKCYGGWSVWPAEEEAQVVRKPLVNLRESDHVYCDVHGTMSWNDLVQEFGNGEEG